MQLLTSNPTPADCHSVPTLLAHVHTTRSHYTRTSFHSVQDNSGTVLPHVQLYRSHSVSSSLPRLLLLQVVVIVMEAEAFQSKCVVRAHQLRCAIERARLCTHIAVAEGNSPSDHIVGACHASGAVRDVSNICKNNSQGLESRTRHAIFSPRNTNNESTKVDLIPTPPLHSTAQQHSTLDNVEITSPQSGPYHTDTSARIAICDCNMPYTD